MRTIDPSALTAEVADPSRGAICTFVGIVRDSHEGQPVVALEYAAYEGMATRELEAIVAEARERFGAPAIVAEHRLGTLAVGETSVAIAAAHARRANAIGAMHYVIEELKKRLPVWKLEHYTDGTRSWVNAAHATGPTRATAADATISAEATIPAEATIATELR